MATSKVKFGLSNLYYAEKQANTSQPYKTPVRIPGAVSISLEPQGDMTKFYADNGVYWQSATNNGYEGDVEVAKIPDSFMTSILGFTQGSNGICAEFDNVEPKEFALLFEFSGDDNHTRYCFYNCIAQRPTVASNTTNDTKEPVTETFSISAVGGEDHIVRGSCETGSTAYTNFFTNVTKPTGV